MIAVLTATSPAVCETSGERFNLQFKCTATTGRRKAGDAASAVPS